MLFNSIHFMIFFPVVVGIDSPNGQIYLAAWFQLLIFYELESGISAVNCLFHAGDLCKRPAAGQPEKSAAVSENSGLSEMGGSPLSGGQSGDTGLF